MPFGERVIVRGEGARVIASPDHLFRAEVSSEALALIFRAGQIPEEMRQRTTDWIDAVLSLAAIQTDTQNDTEGSTFTRRALINSLTRFRRQVAEGRATTLRVDRQSQL